MALFVRNGGSRHTGQAAPPQRNIHRCEIDMQREHYDDNEDRFISELFEEDKARLLPLPSVPFDTPGVCCKVFTTSGSPNSVGV